MDVPEDSDSVILEDGVHEEETNHMIISKSKSDLLDESQLAGIINICCGFILVRTPSNWSDIIRNIIMCGEVNALLVN